MEQDTRSRPLTISWRALVNQFLIIFLSVAFLGAAMGISFYSSHAKTQRVLLEASELQQAKVQKNSITRDFRSIVADLMVQSGHHEFQQVLTGHLVASLGHEFLTFAQKKGLYDQVRFLDETGVEVVRVNYNDGKPFIVPDEDLQSKAAHAYFQNTLQLGEGEVHVSPFDLNIERGKIEQPIKPIIRFGTPVFDLHGRKRGIVVLNYLGAHLIQNFIEVQTNIPGQMMVLNSKGYWLHGPRPEDEWGFMYVDRKGRTFGRAFPEAWEQIVGADSGQFYDADGLSTFITINPLSDVMKSSRSMSQGFDDHAYHSPVKDNAWKVVSRISSDILKVQIHPLRTRLIGLSAGLIVLLALGSWFLARARVSRRYAQDALVESHARSRTIVETAVDGIITIDEQGVIESCNSAATRMFGYNTEEVLGKKVNILMPSPLARQHNESFARYLRTGKARIIGKGQELEGRHKDGLIFPVDLAVSEVRVGERRLFTGIVRDISDRKQAERHVTERTLQVERLLKQKDEFISQLGHDLRTPLTPLVTLLPIMKSLEKDPEIQKYFDVTIESTGYIKDLVQKILLLAKLNSERTPISIADVMLRDVVESFVVNRVNGAHHDNMAIENKVDEHIVVQADHTYLIEVVDNLLSNAVKYSPEGGTITVAAMENNGWVTVSIHDEGAGLTEAQQAKMFDEFYKGDAARHDLKSFGLGLAICTRIVERHGGTIWAESPGLGMGTTIHFTLKSGERRGTSHADENNGR